MELQEKKKAIRYKKKPMPRMDARGKSASYVKNVLIPALKRRVSTAEKNLYHEKVRKKKALERKDLRIKKMQSTFWRKAKKAYAISMKKINLRARELYKNKVKDIRFSKSNAIDGVSCLPILQEFVRKENITLKQLGLFILINHFNWFKASDAVLWGYDARSISRELQPIRDLGWIEAFVGKRNVYVVSVVGKAKFREIQVFTKKKLEEFFNRVEKLKVK